MIEVFVDGFWALMQRGGVVMWILLGLSLVAVTLAFERCWFWICTNHPGRLATVDQLGQLLREGHFDQASQLAGRQNGLYCRLISRIADHRHAAAAVTEAVEAHRSQLERFMPTLSTVITAAPMLGILGTVIGLIAALNILGAEQAVTDPRQVSPAIGQALITTAAGLVVALLVLFPYNAFRAQIDRTISRIEALAAAADTGRQNGSPGLVSTESE